MQDGALQFRPDRTRPLEQQKPKQESLTIQIDPADYGIHSESHVSLFALERLFRAQLPGIIRALPRMYGPELHRTLQEEHHFADSGHRSCHGGYVKSQHPNSCNSEQYPHSHSPQIEGGPTARHYASIQFEVGRHTYGIERGRSINLVIVFSVDAETANEYQDGTNLLGTNYVDPDDLAFHDLYIESGSDRYRLCDGADARRAHDWPIDSGKVIKMIESMNVQENSCERAIADLRRLGQEQEVDPEIIEQLAVAIREFATYHKPEPTTGDMCSAEIGRCFSSPVAFLEFCADRIDVHVPTDYYEVSSGLPMDRPTFFHQVNVLQGNIVIDWTSRQYSHLREDPYPFIYLAGEDDRIPEHWGPMHNLRRKLEAADPEGQKRKERLKQERHRLWVAVRKIQQQADNALHDVLTGRGMAVLDDEITRQAQRHVHAADQLFARIDNTRGDRIQETDVEIFEAEIAALQAIITHTISAAEKQTGSGLAPADQRDFYGRYKQPDHEVYDDNYRRFRQREHVQGKYNRQQAQEHSRQFVDEGLAAEEQEAEYQRRLQKEREFYEQYDRAGQELDDQAEERWQRMVAERMREVEHQKSIIEEYSPYEDMDERVA